MFLFSIFNVFYVIIILYSQQLLFTRKEYNLCLVNEKSSEAFSRQLLNELEMAGETILFANPTAESALVERRQARAMDKWDRSACITFWWMVGFLVGSCQRSLSPPRCSRLLMKTRRIMFLILSHFFFQKYFVSYVQIVSSKGSASLFIERYGGFFLSVIATRE